MIHFHIITLFPDAIRPYLESSILGRAAAARKIKVSYYDPKDFTRDKYGRVDRRPYGGGPGMVLEPEGILRATDRAFRKALGRSYQGLASISRRGLDKAGVEVIFFSTDGKQFDEPMAQKLSKKKDIVFICGHYEGVDERVVKILKAKKVSMGPYVLTGGELPAATVVDAVARFVPGVLGKAESLERSRVSSPEVYTRPEVLVWKGKKYHVPKVLLTGHHAKIEEWKKRNGKD